MNVIIIVAVALLAGVYVSWRAGRLDRLHHRVDTARAALDAALVRRSSVALELAACGLFDPATSLLIAEAAHDARAAGEPAEPAESDLTRALRAALGQPGFQAALAERGRGEDLVAELEAAGHQVFLARKFYNDAVAVTAAARRTWLVRIFRLAGGAPAPEFFEIDDSLVTPDPNARGDIQQLTAPTRGSDPPLSLPGETPDPMAPAVPVRSISLTRSGPTAAIGPGPGGEEARETGASEPPAG